MDFLNSSSRGALSWSAGKSRRQETGAVCIKEDERGQRGRAGKEEERKGRGARRRDEEMGKEKGERG